MLNYGKIQFTEKTTAASNVGAAAAFCQKNLANVRACDTMYKNQRRHDHEQSR